MPTETSPIVAVATADIEHWIEEAKHGALSVPWSDLPAFVRALLMPAVEEGQRRMFAEDQEIILHRREADQKDHAEHRQQDKSPEYQSAYAELFDTIADSEQRVQTTLSDLNVNEAQLHEQLLDVETRAVHLPDGRLAFLENGHFVYEDGQAVGPENLSACEKAKQEADEKHEPLATRQEYLAVQDALAKTIEMEQKLCGVAADARRLGDDVQSNPPSSQKDLKADTAGIRKETDDAVAEARLQIAANEKLAVAQYEADNPRGDGESASPTSASFNNSAKGTAVPAQRPPAIGLDQVIAAATHAP
jgi:hypothetical protein